VFERYYVDRKLIRLHGGKNLSPFAHSTKTFLKKPLRVNERLITVPCPQAREILLINPIADLCVHEIYYDKER
jgi:hypothetical protein